MNRIARTGAGTPFGVMALDIRKGRCTQKFVAAARIHQQTVRAIPCHVTMPFQIYRVKGGVRVRGEEIKWQVALGTGCQELLAPRRLPDVFAKAVAGWTT